MSIHMPLTLSKPVYLLQSISEAMKPNIEWGPALVKYRREAEYHTKRYASDFVVDPWGLETASPNDVQLQVYHQTND